MSDNSELDAAVKRLAAMLRGQKRLLVTAESCTGGGVSHALTAVAGSSDWFERGFVTYSDGAKQEMLSVPADVLAKHGAVSEQTAAAMATGALVKSPADYALSVTGIAGPAGGSAGKPVGTVCFGWAGRGGKVKTGTVQFDGDRAAVRGQSVLHAINGLVDFIKSGA